MSEVKFPPRVFANEDIEDGIDFFEWSLSDTEGPQYLSLQEHNHLLSQLEERLRVAESKIKEAAWSKQEEIGMRCKQNGHMRDYGKALIEEVRKEREELAAIKEKK